jgi:hypothetical protein
MAFAARIETVDDPRRSPRRQMRLSTLARLGDDGCEATVLDLSVSGLLVETRARVRVGDELVLELPRIEHAVARVVWSSGFFYGCQFTNPVSIAVVGAAVLKSAAPDVPAATMRPKVSSRRTPQRHWRGESRQRLFIGFLSILWAILVVTAVVRA